MKIITCTNGMEVMVDDSDFGELIKISWGVNNYGYAVKFKNGHSLLMHRVIIKAPKGSEVDHIDGNKLNNQRSNLRFATKSQNQCNIKRLRSSNTHGVKGVYWDKRRNAWYAQIWCNGKRKCLGCGLTKEDAALKYDVAARELHGEFAVLNSELTQTA